MTFGHTYNQEIVDPIAAIGSILIAQPQTVSNTMKEQILVVEDDRRIRDMLRRTLVFEGYDVVAAEDGEEALRHVRDKLPDAVVLDLMLPGIDGLEVCRRLRAVSDVPIIMLTARDAVPDRIKGLDVGADDYMAKPFAPDELLAR